VAARVAALPLPALRQGDGKRSRRGAGDEALEKMWVSAGGVQ